MTDSLQLVQELDTSIKNGLYDRADELLQQARAAGASERQLASRDQAIAFNKNDLPRTVAAIERRMEAGEKAPVI